MTVVPVRRPRIDVRQELARLAGGRAPFLSVYLDVTPGQKRDGATGRLVRATEAAVGHSRAQQAVAESSLAELHDDDALLVALVDQDGNAVVTGYPDPPTTDLVELGNLPRFGPLLTSEQRLSHHVVALVDGARITIFTVPRHGEATSASYDGTDPMAIAPLIQHSARASKTGLVILCASAAELPSLEANVGAGLPVAAALATVACDELDDDELSTEIVVRVASHAAERTVELMRLWRFHHAHGEAVDGLSSTVAALRSERAALVLVAEELRPDRRLLFGSDPRQVVIDDGAVSNAGRDELLEARASDVVIRSALVADIPVHVVPSVEHVLTDSVGVILADRAEPSELADLLER